MRSYRGTITLAAPSADQAPLRAGEVVDADPSDPFIARHDRGRFIEQVAATPQEDDSWPGVLDGS